MAPDAGSAIQQSKHLQLVPAQEDGLSLFNAAPKTGKEGTIVKPRDVTYQPGAKRVGLLVVQTQALDRPVQPRLLPKRRMQTA